MTRLELLNGYAESTHATLKLWRGAYLHMITDQKLSPALAGPLFALHQRQPLTASELAKELLVTKGAIAQFTNTLLQLGYVERQANPKDGRVVYISLTAQGLQKVQELLEIRKALFQEIAGELTDDELEQAIRINDKITRTLERKKDR